MINPVSEPSKALFADEATMLPELRMIWFSPKWPGRPAEADAAHAVRNVIIFSCGAA